MAEQRNGPAAGPDPTARPAGTEGGQVRAETDAGRLRDKIPVEDPATAPLGTDTEAGGARAPAPSAADPRRPDAQSRWPEGQRAGPVPSRGRNMSALGLGLGGVLVLGILVLLIAGIF